MKTNVTVFILSFFVFSQTAFAATPGHKLVRGVEGVVTSPLEYINQYQMASSKRGLVAGLFTGVVGGTAMTVKRIVNGAYDIVSFPVSAPKDYGLLLADESETALDSYTETQNSGSFPLKAK